MPVAPDTASAARQGLRGALLSLASIGLGAWALLQSDVGAAAVAGLLERASPLPLLAAILAMTGGTLFLALRWRALMPDRAQVRVSALSGFLVVGTLLNYALPGPAGEFVAASLAGRRFGMATEVALAASVHGRFIGLAMAGTVAGVLYLAADMPVPAAYVPWIGLATLGVTALSLGLAALSAWPGALRRVADLTLGRVSFFATLHAAVVRLADALAAVGRLGATRWLEAAGWALAGHALVITGTGLGAMAFGGAPDPAGLAFTYAMATAGAVVLFAFPGSQVGWDAMFTTLLVTCAGLTLPEAAATALVVRVQQLGMICVGAVAMLRASFASGAPHPPGP